MKDADNFLSFTELKERFDVKTNLLVYHGLVSCIKLLRTVIENQTEENRNFSTFVENFMKLLNPIDWYTKSWGALNKVALGKAKRNGVPTAVFSAPRQLIGRWLTNYLSTVRKLPN